MELGLQLLDKDISYAHQHACAVRGTDREASSHPFTLVLGLIAGYYQEKHNNISYAILVHAGGNIMGLVSILLTAG